VLGVQCVLSLDAGVSKGRDLRENPLNITMFSCEGNQSAFRGDPTVGLIGGDSQGQLLLVIFPRLNDPFRACKSDRLLKPRRAWYGSSWLACRQSAKLAVPLPPPNGNTHARRTASLSAD
jgi:hypothetical protein